MKKFLNNILGARHKEKIKERTKHVLLSLERMFHSLHTDVLELRRKTLHLILGAFISGMIWLEILDAIILFSFSFFFLGFFLLFREFQKKTPLLYVFFRLFERPKHMCIFPGKSAVFFFFACSFSALLFPRDIAVASIIILAFGDSISHLVGHHFGKIKTPLHPAKNLEGPLAAIVVSTGIASFFVPLFPAFLASTVAMAIEIPEWKIFGWHIDDNILIPLVSGTILLLF
jgi:dolichol kinase